MYHLKDKKMDIENDPQDSHYYDNDHNDHTDRNDENYHDNYYDEYQNAYNDPYDNNDLNNLNDQSDHVDNNDTFHNDDDNSNHIDDNQSINTDYNENLPNYDYYEDSDDSNQNHYYELSDNNQNYEDPHNQYDLSDNESIISEKIEDFSLNYDNLEDGLFVQKTDFPITTEFKNKIIYNYMKIDNERKIIENMYLKQEHLFKKKIYDFVLYFQGCIFGGAIRDIILHKKGAQSFYEKYDKYFYSNNISLYDSKKKSHHFFNVSEKILVCYTDKDFDPASYINRNTIINDIDAVMQVDQFELLINYIKSQNNYNCYCNTFHNFKNYIHINDPEELISCYKRVYIKKTDFFDKNNKQVYDKFDNFDKFDKFNIKRIESNLVLDIFICKNDQPKKEVVDLITETSDFYCNSLYILNGFHYEMNIKNMNTIKEEPKYESIHENDTKKTIDIFLQKNIYKNEVKTIVENQILQREAVHIKKNHLFYKRVKKMKKKNFKLIFDKLYFKKIIIENETCLFCMDTILNDKKHIKFLCCNSNFHEDCLKIILKSEKNKVTPCYMCKKNVDFKYIEKYLNFEEK